MATTEERSGANIPPLFAVVDGPSEAESTAPARDEQWAFFEFDETDHARLPALRTRLTPLLPEIIHDYYDHLAQFGPPAAALAGVDREQYEAHLSTYLQEVLSADFSAAHLERRRRIGLAHGEGGLAHTWFTGSYRFLERRMGQALRGCTDDLEAYLADRRTLDKLMSYDLGLVMNAHVQEYAEQLHERNAALLREKEFRAQWAHMLVHDMASPLSTVTTATEVLAAHGDDLAVYARCVDVLRRAERRLKDMLNDMLDVYAGAAAPLDITPEPFDLRSMAEEVLAEFDLPDVPELPEYLLDAPVLLPRVHADRPLVMRVLRNLVDNASKYTTSEGQVAIQLRTNPDARLVIVRVEDSGEGIAPESRARVFDPYYTAGPASGPIASQTRRGTGLGLTFCKTVIEAHGHTITVESPASGVGTAFAFSLPCAEPGA